MYEEIKVIMRSLFKQSVLSPSKKGFYIEYIIHTYLSNIYKICYNEKEIKKKYGLHVSGIDHLFHLNNHIISIQTKFHTKKIGLKDSNHFIKCCYDIYDTENTPMVCIMLSKHGITKNSKCSFQSENNKTNNLTFTTICGLNALNMINRLNRFLFKYKI